MKKYILSFIFALTCLGLKAQQAEITIVIYNDSTAFSISNYEILDIEQVSNSRRFHNIPEKWTHYVRFVYQSKYFEIPIDSKVHFITVIDNPKASGFCSRITYLTPPCLSKTSEHGNNCKEMNEVFFNDPVYSKPDLRIDGVRTIPFNY